MHTDTLRRGIQELGPWYQNIELAAGVWTKNLEGKSDIFPEHDIPRPLWELIERDLGDLTGQSVLDIGCNAGYMSFGCKRLGAAQVVGIDSNLGSGKRTFIEQAEFCREALGLDVQFQEASLFGFSPPRPYDLVLFCGVLYHLEDFARALDRLRELAQPRTGRIVLETAIEPVTRTYPGAATYNGDSSTFFVPSIRVLLELVRERGFNPYIVRDIGSRAIAFLAVD